MTSFFSADELLDIAVGIEKNGQSFYKYMSDITRSQSARSVYLFLADQEKRHESAFQKMRQAGPRVVPPETYPGEYESYLKALVDSLVFKSSRDWKLSGEVDNEIHALATGIQAEKDSLVFYSEMASLIKVSGRETLEEIIKEEKSHLRQLSELKSLLEKGGV